MRNLIWVVLAVVVVALGYLLMKDDGAAPIMSDMNDDAATEESAPAEVEAPEPMQETVEDAVNEAMDDAAAAMDQAEEAVSDAVSGAVESASEAAEAAGDAASDAVENMSDAASDAADTAMDSASDAAEATSEAADDAMDMASDAAEATGEAAAEAMESASDAAPEASSETPDSLTLDGFDLEKAKEQIDNSSLGEMTKMTLKAAIEKAEESPELLETALEKVREALGF
ncbi:hypothetical protein [Shimia aestuarii]|uniref:hypothetical protein n=1 Tax=Shimia aestuarii TaxID=254406 RepID=UPI001FB32AC2|nr:hypothetical protein [Shimia aestuarii]